MSSPPSPLRTAALLAFLTWLNVLNFVDRTLITTLARQISGDPDLNIKYETIGFLYGYGFIVFYTLIGVLMGTLADRWHRPRLMAGGLALWSAVTAATGLARSFVQIAVCRAFVGVGEATLTPSALSMLGDRFPLRQRAFAAGTYYAGIPLGAGCGMIVSGYLLPHYGWRGCFVILGLLGVLFVIPLLFMKDRVKPVAPLAGPLDPAPATEPQRGAFLTLMSTLVRSPAMICTILGSVMAVYAQSSGAFVLTWLQEERGMEYAPTAKLGGWLYLCGGTLGSITGGLLGDWFHHRFQSGGRLWYLAMNNLIFTPLAFLFYLGDVHAWYFEPLWIAVSFGSMVWYGPLFSTMADLAPARCRATAVALLLFCMNFLGTGLGPLITGWFGQHLSEAVASDSPLRSIIQPILDIAGLDSKQGFTFGLMLAASVGFCALPFNITAALRYGRDVLKAQETDAAAA